MIWIVRTRCVMAGTGREWIHFVRCIDSEKAAIAAVARQLNIPKSVLEFRTKKCEDFVFAAEIERRVWHYAG